MIILIVLLILPAVHSGTISTYLSIKVSNIPVIVSENKNYTSSEPTWLTSPFFRAGYEDVIKVYTGSNVPSTDYTFTFSSALPGVPYLAYGIKRYRGTYTSLFRQRLFRSIILLDQKDSFNCDYFQCFYSNFRYNKFMDLVSGIHSS